MRMIWSGFLPVLDTRTSGARVLRAVSGRVPRPEDRHEPDDHR